jgi:hypothetical protein
MRTHKNIAMTAWECITKAIDDFNDDSADGHVVHYPKELQVDGEVYYAEELQE